jgi:hypothetical protein
LPTNSSAADLSVVTAVKNGQRLTDTGAASGPVAHTLPGLPGRCRLLTEAMS